MNKKIVILLLSALFSLPSFADIVIVGNPALPDGLTKKDAKNTNGIGYIDEADVDVDASVKVLFKP